MCLGIPGQIVALHPDQPRLARVSVGGVEREVNIACILGPDEEPQSALGAWVLVHVGFAMARIDADEAARTLELLSELGEIAAELQGSGNGTPA